MQVHTLCCSGSNATALLIFDWFGDVFTQVIHVLTTPDTHGTITGAFGCESRYSSEYMSLKFSFGFSDCSCAAMEKARISFRRHVRGNQFHDGEYNVYSRILASIPDFYVRIYLVSSNRSQMGNKPKYCIFFGQVLHF